MEQICHYCCRIPRTIGPATRRNLRAELKERESTIAAAQSKTIPEGAKEYYVGGLRYLVRAENFQPLEEDEDTYFRRLQDEHNTNNRTVHDEDYEDIEWFPYEWMLKVGTEYYFRYV
jgi:hypothetical protein